MAPCCGKCGHKAEGDDLPTGWGTIRMTTRKGTRGQPVTRTVVRWALCSACRIDIQKHLLEGRS
jgi:hypothetical protein